MATRVRLGGEGELWPSDLSLDLIRLDRLFRRFFLCAAYFCSRFRSQQVPEILAPVEFVDALQCVDDASPELAFVVIGEGDYLVEQFLFASCYFSHQLLLCN